jgi:peroxiredoxin
VPRVGSIAPNLRLTRLDGTPVSLDEFRGQRVLINSWASW